MSLKNLERMGENPISSQIRWYRRPDTYTLTATNNKEIQILNHSLPAQTFGSYSYRSSDGTAELFSRDSSLVDNTERALLTAGMTKED